MNISHISCSEILIVSLTVTGSIGLITYYSDSNALGQQAYREQKQILTERGQAFTDAKNTLLSSLIEHLNSHNFKEKSIQQSIQASSSQSKHPTCQSKHPTCQILCSV